MRAHPRKTGAATASVAVGLALLVAGCDAVSDDPVPTVAKAPFVCDGVPLEGARLMTGTPEIERYSSGGEWGDPSEPIVCNLNGPDGSGVLTVSQGPLVWYGFDDPTAYIETVAGREGTQEIAASAQGAGYAYRESENSASAQWACGEHRLMVNVYRLAGGDRDPLTDVSRYLTSMLPWACEGAEVPARTG